MSPVGYTVSLIHYEGGHPDLRAQLQKKCSVKPFGSHIYYAVHTLRRIPDNCVYLLLIKG